MPIDDIMNNSKPSHEEVDILMRADLEFERSRLDMEFRKLTGGEVGRYRDNRLAGKREVDPAVKEEADRIKARVDEIEAEMAANVLTFHIDGVSSPEYSLLQGKSGKPRQGNLEDNQAGFNLFEFYKILIKRCTTKVASPDGDEQEFSDEQWETLWEKLSDIQFDMLCDGARRVNRQAPKAPSTARTSARLQ